MKKTVTFIVTLALSLCLLSGCTSASNSAKNIRIGSLKGPTSIGLMKMMDDTSYSFELATTADELLPKMISGDLDIALVPANVSSVLYNKSEGAVQVIDINTLGVLYAVSADDSIASVKDLVGKNVYITNKGTTPEYITQYLLKANGIDISDVNIEYKSESAEVAAILNSDPEAVGILPQPFVTACMLKNDSLKDVLDLTAEWDKINPDSKLLTGVTIVRKEFLENNKDAITRFMKDHEESVEYAVSNVEDTAGKVVEAGIIEKEPLAVKAIPKCNVVYIDGSKMQNDLMGYLEVLYELDPSSVGGKLPNDDFYYMAE